MARIKKEKAPVDRRASEKSLRREAHYQHLASIHFKERKVVTREEAYQELLETWVVVEEKGV